MQITKQPDRVGTFKLRYHIKGLVQDEIPVRTAHNFLNLIAHFRKLKQTLGLRPYHILRWETLIP